MKARWKRWLVWALVLAGLALAARAMAHFPWAGVWTALKTAGPGWIAVSTVLAVLSLLAKGWGWHLLMSGGRLAGLKDSEWAHMLGAATMALTVSVGSEAVRVGAVNSRAGVPVSRAVAAAAWSRIAETISLVLLLMPASLLAMPASFGHLRLPAAALAVVAAVVVALLLAPGLRRRLFLPALLRKLPRRWMVRVGRVASVGGGRPMFGALAMAALNWLLQWGSYDAAMRAVGIHAPLVAALAVIVAVNLGGLFHLTPGNVGVLQAGTVLVLGAFGVTAAEAMAAGLVLQAVQTLPPILIGVALVGYPWKILRELGSKDGDASGAGTVGAL